MNRDILRKLGLTPSTEIDTDLAYQQPDVSFIDLSVARRTQATRSSSSSSSSSLCTTVAPSKASSRANGNVTSGTATTTDTETDKNANTNSGCFRQPDVSFIDLDAARWAQTTPDSSNTNSFHSNPVVPSSTSSVLRETPWKPHLCTSSNMTKSNMRSNSSKASCGTLSEGTEYQENIMYSDADLLYVNRRWSHSPSVQLEDNMGEIDNNKD